MKDRYEFRVRNKTLDTLMEKHGIRSQTELAQRLGVRAATVSAIVNHRTSPGPDFIGRATQTFGVDQAELFELTRVEPAAS